MHLWLINVLGRSKPTDWRALVAAETSDEAFYYLDDVSRASVEVRRIGTASEGINRGILFEGGNEYPV